jgi:hypothetical protein
MSHPLKTNKQTNVMARPKKNNCDYFSHDNGMRNNKKVRALRAKFGHEGYSIWNMILEYLTGCDFLQFTYSELEFELLAGDFDTTSERLKEIINYLINIKLIQIDTATVQEGTLIYCVELSARLSYVFDRRNGNQREFRVSEIELMQSKIPKVNESKVKEMKVNEIENPFKDSIAFGEAWQNWEKYRAERRQKLTPSSVKMQIKFLSSFSEETAIQIINQSIANGWQGLFELKQQTNGKRTLKDSANIIANYFEGQNNS